VPSIVLSSTASDQCVVHHCSWHHFSCDQHSIVFPHLAQKPRYAPPVLAQELGVACFGLAVSFPRIHAPAPTLLRRARAALPVRSHLPHPRRLPMSALQLSRPASLVSPAWLTPTRLHACSRHLGLLLPRPSHSRACRQPRLQRPPRALRPTPAHTANFHAPSRACSRYPLGAELVCPLRPLLCSTPTSPAPRTEPPASWLHLHGLLPRALLFPLSARTPGCHPAHAPLALRPNRRAGLPASRDARSRHAAPPLAWAARLRSAPGAAWGCSPAARPALATSRRSTRARRLPRVHLRSCSRAAGLPPACPA
jgi:hypothetical protein